MVPKNEISEAALSKSPLDDIRALFGQMPGPDEEAVDAVRRRDGELTKPAGSLGRLEEIAEWLAAWQRKAPPTVDAPMVLVFAGNHGVADKGVSAFPASVTAQMVDNFRAGGAAINQICRQNSLGLRVFDLALEVPTADITQAPALEERDCAATIAFGMEAIAGGHDLICIGEMGIANTTVASALCLGLFGGTAADWAGPGTGVDADGLARKTAAIEQAALRHDREGDPFDALAGLGGRELAAMAGTIIAARFENTPVIVDGFVASAAAAVIHAFDPHGLDHCIFGHVSAEPAHRRLLEIMSKAPLLDLGMRLGEASGAALAAGIVKTAAATHRDMATFSSAGVDGKDA